MNAVTTTKPFYNYRVPSDWSTPEFGTVFDILKSFSFSRDQLTDERTAEGIQCIHYGDIHATFEDEILDLEIELRIPFVKDDLINHEALGDEEFPLLRDGDLIIADVSEDYEGVAECVELTNVNGKRIVSGLHTFAARDRNEMTEEGYRTYILKHPQVVRQLRRIATGFSVFGISKSNISRLILAIPPRNEQKMIAHILKTMDIAISKNTQLITQKELQKKWLMQNLLTGKKRLKQNDRLKTDYGEWKTVLLGDVFKFVKSYAISRGGLSKMNCQNLTYCIHYGDIHALYESDFLNFSAQQSIPQIIDQDQVINERDFLKEGDVIMADASEDYDGVGEAVEVVNLQSKTAVGGLHTIVLRANPAWIAEIFRGYLFASEPVRNELRRLATGTSVYSVAKTTLQSLSLNIPTALKEQAAIAHVLQSADKEIQLLKTKTEKLREKKKWLMQVLLTGKRRLIS